ncbi:tyrosine-type recombinase/integrase [Neobacillus cucumis]|nr:tyrosine-type recombinase/integrase [Neobacillus cucumis]
MIYTAGNTGARLGELRALKWTDIDFDNRRITITKSAYVDEEGKVQIKDLTKGEKDGTIVIGKKLMNVLNSHYTRYQEIKNRLGDSFNSNDLVFLNSNGDYTHPRELHRIYKRAIKQAGLKDSRFQTQGILTLPFCYTKKCTSQNCQ